MGPRNYPKTGAGHSGKEMPTRRNERYRLVEAPAIRGYQNPHHDALGTEAGDVRVAAEGSRTVEVWRAAEPPLASSVGSMLAYMARRIGVVGLAPAVVIAGCGGSRHAAASTPGGASTAAATPVDVYLLQSQGLKLVKRQLPARTMAAITALLKGPTAAEAKREIRTQVRPGVGRNA